MTFERARVTRLFAGAALTCAASIASAAVPAPPAVAATGIPHPCTPKTCPLFPGDDSVAGSVYLRVPGVSGESKRPGHEDQIEVLSWSWGAGDSQARTTSDPQEGGEVVRGVNSMKPPERATSDPQEGGEIVKGVETMKAPEPAGSAAAARKGKAGPAISGMKFVKRADKASPMLRGAPPPSGSLTLVVPAGACTAGARYPSMDLAAEDGAYRLEDVVVTGCSPADEKAGGDRPTETLTLNYAKISVKQAR
jgi:type VI protein secretion system component Hcp